MGRPIKKQFFSNLNAPYQDQASGGLTGGGGSGVGTITVTDQGNNYISTPAITIAPPDLPGGVQAVASVGSMVAKSGEPINVGTSGSYDIGQELTAAGTATTAAVFTVTSIGVRTVTVAARGVGYSVGEYITMSGAGWTTDFVATVATINGSGGILTLDTPSLPGIRNAAAPTNPVAPTGVTTGSNATFNFTWGVAGVSTPSANSYTQIAPNPVATAVNTGTGVGATLNIEYGVRTVNVTTAGAGYSTEPDVSTTGNGVFASHLAGGNVKGIATLVYLKAEDGGTQALAGDILKQESSRRYLVRTEEGTSQCSLIDDIPTAGTMNIFATDVNGSVYYVTKLTARRARLTQKTSNGSGFEYQTGDVAGWSLDSATVGRVSIGSV